MGNSQGDEQQGDTFDCYWYIGVLRTVRMGGSTQEQCQVSTKGRIIPLKGDQRKGSP